MPTSIWLGASSSPPAGGAATSDVIYATAGAVVATILLLGPILLYKQGRFPLLGRLADLDEKATKLPGWAARYQVLGMDWIDAGVMAAFGCNDDVLMESST